MRILLLVFLSTVSLKARSFSGDGMPFKFISSCEIDLNGDQKADKAMLIEGLNGRELIALIAKAKGYDAFVVATGKENMFLNCKKGNSIKETMSGNGRGKTYNPPGAYLELVKPESSSVAYFFTKNTFQEVWTAD